MSKVLVKCKIVLSSDGTGLTTYFWKRTFLCFGYWYPWGCSSSGGKIPFQKICKINDNEVSKLIFDNIITNHNYHDTTTDKP